MVTKRDRMIGLTCALLAAISFAGGGILLVFGLREGSTPTQAALIQFATQFLVLLPILTARKTNILGHSKETFVILLVRGFFGAIGVVFVTIAYTKLPLGTAMVIINTYCVFSGLLACMFLSEACGVFEIIVTMVTIVGIVLIAQPPLLFDSSASGTFEDENVIDRILGVSLALAGALVTAIVMVLIRKMGLNVHFTLSGFYFAWEGIFICIIYLYYTGEMCIPCLSVVLHLFGVGCVLFISQILLTLALQYENAGPVSLVKTTQAMFAFLFEFIFVGTVPNLHAIIGSAIVFLSSSVLIVRNIRKVS